MIELKIEELAKMLGKTRMEIEEILKSSDVIELNLSERKSKQRDEDDELRIYD